MLGKELKKGCLLQTFGDRAGRHANQAAAAGSGGPHLWGWELHTRGLSLARVPKGTVRGYYGFETALTCVSDVRQ